MYVVKSIPERPGSKKIAHRVYDTERGSFPIHMRGGRRLEQSYPTAAEAQAVANELNEEQ